MTIAVDFDGTIVEHKYPAIGKELPFAIATLKKLADNGHHIILWSVREGKLLDEAVEYCRKQGLEFYAVNAEYPGASWNRSNGSRKIAADVYIDDRNLGGIPDWNIIYEMLTCHMSYADMIEKMQNEGNVKLEIYNGTFHKHSKHSRNGFFARLSRKCREARSHYRF